MYASIEHNQETARLYVADVLRSRQFYQDLLGLASSEVDIPREDIAVLQDSGPDELRLELRQQLDEQDRAARIWLSIEVDTVTDVLDLYLLAIMLGAKAQLPRKRGERWNTVVLDPDGNQISVWTRMPEHERRSGRDEWSDRRLSAEASRRGDDARSGRSMEAAEHCRRWGRQGRERLWSERSFLMDTPAGRLPDGEGD